MLLSPFADIFAALKYDNYLLLQVILHNIHFNTTIIADHSADLWHSLDGQPGGLHEPDRVL
jgi:hypothetical protein